MDQKDTTDINQINELNSSKKNENPGRIKEIPRDDATRKKIADIIDHQFDLELCLKHRELATIRQEIARAESAMNDLTLAVKNESMASSIPEAPHYTRRTAAAAMYIPPAPPPPPPKKKVSKPVHRYSLFGRRSDGLFVRLSCPACRRDDFANQQGFLNHCRLAHGLEFGPYEQIMIRCGKVVDESEVPFDHPARMRPVTKPVPLSTQGSLLKKERPTIKVFEEDVDLELDHEGHGSYQNDFQSLNPEALTSNQPANDGAKDRRDSQSDNQDRSRLSSRGQDNGSEMQNNRRSSSPEARPFESSKCLPDTEKPKEDEEKRNDKSKEEEQVGQVVAPVESFAAAHEGGSRFYIKRRIIVGNWNHLRPKKLLPLLLECVFIFTQVISQMMS
ncbi:hypothetical protein CLU79DRAFT_131441 [Phycomyces nitens]|nr:hypothetical protein CLU79DRAFT_131441 [Phycomyces nitens]